MGQAKRRGTFEERKESSLARRKAQDRIDREAWLQRQAERDVLMDRDYVPPERTGRPTSVIGTGGFGRGGRRGSPMMLMAAMLAATAGIGPVMADDRRCR